MSTTSVKETFRAFDNNIHARFKTDSRGYEGDKPNPKDWADLIESDPDFQEEFTRIFNDDRIKEADDYIPETLDDTYLNMEITLPRDGDGPEYARLQNDCVMLMVFPLAQQTINPY